MNAEVQSNGSGQTLCEADIPEASLDGRDPCTHNSSTKTLAAMQSSTD